jgi:hypothetical protein
VSRLAATAAMEEARDGMAGVTSRQTTTASTRFHVGGSERRARVSGAGQSSIAGS